MIIDTHLHIWSGDCEKCPMDGDRTAMQNGHKMAEARVDKAVIVQPIHYLFDNSYVADTLQCFVGEIEPTSPGRISERWCHRRDSRL